MNKKNNYKNGAQKERRILNSFKKRGCIGARSAGSHSPIDVWIIDGEHKKIYLIQSKLGKLSQKQREEILSLQRLNGFYEVRFELWE